MQCPKCSQRVVEGAKRCPACGASLKGNFLGRFLRLLISEKALQQMKEEAAKAAGPSAPLPEAKEGEFLLMVASVMPQSGEKVTVNGRLIGAGDLRAGDHMALTMPDKTVKTCNVVKVSRVGDMLGIEIFAEFVTVELSGISAREIKVGDLIKKV